MNIKERFGQSFAEFSSAMEVSPNRDLVIYRCAHSALLLLAVILVFYGFFSAVFAVIVLSLVLTGRNARQVYLSRRFSLAGLIVLGTYVIGLLVALPFAKPAGFFASPAGFSMLLMLAGSLIVWFFSANRLYNAEFQLPPEDTGPW